MSEDETTFHTRTVQLRQTLGTRSAVIGVMAASIVAMALFARWSVAGTVLDAHQDLATLIGAALGLAFVGWTLVRVRSRSDAFVLRADELIVPGGAAIPWARVTGVRRPTLPWLVIDVVDTEATTPTHKLNVKRFGTPFAFHGTTPSLDAAARAIAERLGARQG